MHFCEKGFWEIPEAEYMINNEMLLPHIFSFEKRLAYFKKLIVMDQDKQDRNPFDLIELEYSVN